MTYAFSGNHIWHLITQADALSIAILSVLLILSIVSWALFLGKLVALHSKKRQLKMVLAQIAQAKTNHDLRVIANRLAGTLPSYFIIKSLVMGDNILTQRGGDISFERKRHDVVQLRYDAERLIDTVIELQESYIPLFSTIASVAPLIGLLGTIWGLIHSFVRISQYQSADIVTVAPGIAEALIATLGGLLVAIPALVMYNYSLMQVRSFEKKLLSLSDQVNTILTKLLVE